MKKNEDRKIESSRSKISTHMKLIFAVILLLDELWQPLLSTLNKYENNKCNMFYIQNMFIKFRSRFFVQGAHETTSGGNHQFFTIFNVSVCYQLSPQRLQYSDLQSHFSVLKNQWNLYDFFL